MFNRQKPLASQVIVITGATSGIGLATARMASQKGARLVLAARNGDALRDIATRLERDAGDVVTVMADVGIRADVEAIAARAIERFGGFDTWVNNAGQTIFGRLLDISQEDHEQLMRTNFWGTVNGSLIAVSHLRIRGGTLINVGSIGSDFAFPLQGMYSASKHAIRGFTDALRMELEAEGVPVTITLIKPASIDSPLPQRSRNTMEREPKLPPPVYRPAEVAHAILNAARSSKRDVYVGGGGRAISVMAALAPRLFDRTAPLIMVLQKRKEPPRNPAGGLHAPIEDGLERGSYPGLVIPFSAYTRAMDRPFAAAVLLAAGTLGLALLSGQSVRKRSASSRATGRRQR